MSFLLWSKPACRLPMTLLVLAAAACLAGCTTTTGTKIDPADLTSFKSGVSTINDVEAKLGSPASRSTDAQGVSTLSYVYQQTNTSGTTFIPVVGLFAGSTAVQQQEVDFTFDRSGILTNYTRSDYNNNARQGG